MKKESCPIPVPRLISLPLPCRISALVLFYLLLYAWNMPAQQTAGPLMKGIAYRQMEPEGSECSGRRCPIVPPTPMWNSSP